MRVDIAEEVGLAAAVVHQQIWHHIDYDAVKGRAHRPGWYTGTAEEVAALCPLSAPQVRRAMASLIEAGLMQRVKWRASQGDHTSSYRPIQPEERNGQNPLNQRSDEIVNSGSDESVKSGSDESVKSTSIGEYKTKNPPNPPVGGNGTGPEPSPSGNVTPLFDPSTLPDTRQARVRKHATTSAALEASFAPWWDDYPSGKTRGARAAALRAWSKTVGSGRDRNREPVTAADLYERLGNYRLARAAYAEHWAAMGVDAHAPLMNGATFINSKSSMFAEPWTPEDLTYWPPPRGLSWDSEPSRGEDLQQALQDEIAAERAARNQTQEVAANG